MKMVVAGRATEAQNLVDRAWHAAERAASHGGQRAGSRSQWARTVDSIGEAEGARSLVDFVAEDLRRSDPAALVRSVAKAIRMGVPGTPKHRVTVAMMRGAMTAAADLMDAATMAMRREATRRGDL